MSEELFATLIIDMMRLWVEPERERITVLMELSTERNRRG